MAVRQTEIMRALFQIGFEHQVSPEEMAEILRGLYEQTGVLAHLAIIEGQPLETVLLMADTAKRLHNALNPDSPITW